MRASAAGRAAARRQDQRAALTAPGRTQLAPGGEAFVLNA